MENHLTNNPPAPNPNEALAEQIFQKLLDAGLISADGQARFLKNLAQGALKESDWKVALEQVLNTSAHETPET